jgi:hypothetical protein
MDDAAKRAAASLFNQARGAAGGGVAAAGAEEPAVALGVAEGSEDKEIVADSETLPRLRMALISGVGSVMPGRPAPEWYRIVAGEI